MGYNSKYSGEEVEVLLDMVASISLFFEIDDGMNLTVTSIQAESGASLNENGELSIQTG